MLTFYWLMSNVLLGGYKIRHSEALPKTANFASELIGGVLMKSDRFKDTNEMCLYLYKTWNLGRIPADVGSKEANEQTPGLLSFRCYDLRPRIDVQNACLTEAEVPFSEHYFLQCDVETEDAWTGTYHGQKFKRRSPGRAPNYGKCIPKPPQQAPSGSRTGVSGQSPAGQSSIHSAEVRSGQVACVEESAEGADRHVNAWTQAISAGSDASSMPRITVPWMSITEVDTENSVSTNDVGFLSMNTDPSGRPKVYRACAHQAPGHPNVMLKIGLVS